MSDYSIPEDVAQAIATWLDSDTITESQRAQLIGAQFLEGPARRQVENKVLEQVGAGLTADEEDLEDRISLEVANLRVRTEAERRLASENYSGTTELSWDDLDGAERDYLVKDLVPQDGIVFLVARANIGKTLGYVDMACSMSCGLEWLGKPTKQTKTLIVLGEGKAGFMRRLKAWCESKGQPLDSLKPWLAFIDGGNLNNDESLARIQEVADRHEAELIIFDTWAGTSGVAKEEDNALNATTLNRAQTIREGATLFFVHHPRKAEEKTDAPVMRGASSLFGRADVVMTMYDDKGFIAASGEKYEFIALSTEADHNGKNRDAQTETIRGLYLEEVLVPGDSEATKVFCQLVSESISKNARKVREALTQPMTIREFAEAAKVSESTARRYLKDAVQDGIAVYNAGSGITPDRYAPTQRWTTLQSTAAATPFKKAS